MLLPVRGRPNGLHQADLRRRDGLVRRVVDIWEKDGEVSRRTVVREKVVVLVKTG